MSDNIDQKLNNLQKSLDEVIKSLDTRLSAVEEVLHIAKPAEAHDFVWAMHQLRSGLPVKCLAIGVIYASRASGCIVCTDHIEFSSRVVNSVWTLAPGWERSETHEPSLRSGSFDWAMQQLKDGKRIRRRAWHGDIYWKLDDPKRFCLNADIDANDWEVYHEPHDIHWAVKQLQDDKIVKRRCWKAFRLYPHDAIRLEVEDISADDWELAEDND